jgi:hypothetical protein
MRIKASCLAFSALFLLANLSGCGGGGGSDAPIASSSTFNVQAALLGFLNDQKTYSVAGTLGAGNSNGYDGGMQYLNISGTFTYSPITNYVSRGFLTHPDGSTLNSKALFLTVNGETSSGRWFWTAEPYLLREEPEVGLVRYVSQLGPLPPTNALIGSSSVWVTTREDVRGAINTTNVGSYRWQLAPDTGSTALLNIFYSAQDLNQTRSYSENWVGRVTPDGEFTLLEYHLDNSGFFGYGSEQADFRFSKR